MADPNESESAPGPGRDPEQTDDSTPRPHQGRGGHAQRRPALALDPDVPAPSHPPEIPVERLDPDAVKVISRLRHMGHQAYFVGGCVRDLLLERKPKDFDLATDAHPGEVRAIFRNCRLIGRRFRLAHVYFRGGKVIEVATFRANPVDALEDVAEESDLLITRDNVFGTAEEDARRRDFTVNGLFYDPFAGEVIDYVGGRHDLEAHRIATIGDPEIRMREDPVRALRAIRFAARLGFAIEPEAFAAMRRHAAEIARCAPPRVLEEVFKILRCGNAARAFELFRASGALPVVLPALAHALDRGGDEGRRRFQAHLAALDHLVRTSDEVSEAVLLGSLLMHLRHGPEGEDGADSLLTALVQTARLPRRMAERTRLALGAQRMLRAPARRRRRRRGGPTAQAYFQDALLLLEMTVRATGEGAEELARWKVQAEAQLARRQPDEGGEGERSARPSRTVHAASTPGSPVDAPETPIRTIDLSRPAREAAPGSGPPGEGQRRRRRRGGRRRRRRVLGPGGGPPAA
jgi:poly(A) polymerase